MEEVRNLFSSAELDFDQGKFESAWKNVDMPSDDEDDWGDDDGGDDDGWGDDDDGAGDDWDEEVEGTHEAKEEEAMSNNAMVKNLQNLFEILTRRKHKFY